MAAGEEVRKIDFSFMPIVNEPDRTAPGKPAERRCDCA